MAKRTKKMSTKNQSNLYSFVAPKGGWEVPRKIFHGSVGFLALVCYMLGIKPKDVYPSLVVFLCIVGTAEVLRFNIEWFNKIYCVLMGPLMRQTEIKTKVNGVVYYLLGCIFVLYFFPKDLATVSITYLSWVDPTASICGKLWGKYTIKFGDKSLAGSLGASIMGSLVTFLYFGVLSRYSLSYLPSSSIPLWLFVIYGGLVSSFSEGISNLLFGLDDNFTIPVISVILLWIPLVGFGWGY